jgi:hypothetical protein
MVWSHVFPLLLSSCSMPAPTFESVASLAPSTDGSLQTNVVTTTQIPVIWADLGLSGRLVYINGLSVDNVFQLQVQVLDLISGEVTTIYDAP